MSHAIKNVGSAKQLLLSLLHSPAVRHERRRPLQFPTKNAESTMPQCRLIFYPEKKRRICDAAVFIVSTPHSSSHTSPAPSKNTTKVLRRKKRHILSKLKHITATSEAFLIPKSPPKSAFVKSLAPTLRHNASLPKYGRYILSSETKELYSINRKLGRGGKGVVF